MSGKFIVALTRSQQMALLDLISEFIGGPGTREFVDCSSSPAVVTTPGQLITLVHSAQFFHDGGEIPNTKARLVSE